MSTYTCEWWGEHLDYEEVYKRQLSARADVAQGKRGPFFAALTHSPTITLGRREADAPEQSVLNNYGISLCTTNRGGLATYHGPSQLMVYMFIDTRVLGIRIRDVVKSIEQGLINWLRGEGVKAECVCGSPGVYVRNPDSSLAKIAAIGLNFSKGVSMHGLALYLLSDSEPFELIDPCGVKGAEVTSVQKQVCKIYLPEESYPKVVESIWETLSLHCKKG